MVRVQKSTINSLDDLKVISPLGEVCPYWEGESRGIEKIYVKTNTFRRTRLKPTHLQI